jgi:hypothetical protein
MYPARFASNSLASDVKSSRGCGGVDEPEVTICKRTKSIAMMLRTDRFGRYRKTAMGRSRAWLATGAAVPSTGDS